MTRALLAGCRPSARRDTRSGIQYRRTGARSAQGGSVSSTYACHTGRKRLLHLSALSSEWSRSASSDGRGERLCHIEGTPAHAPSGGDGRALDGSRPLGSLVGCPTCFHSSGVRVLPMTVDDQDGVPSLVDAPRPSVDDLGRKRSGSLDESVPYRKYSDRTFAALVAADVLVPINRMMIDAGHAVAVDYR